MDKLKVGDKLYYDKGGSIGEKEVAKIGNKYAYAFDNWGSVDDDKIELSTLIMRGFRDIQFYRSQEQLMKVIEHGKLTNRLRKAFAAYDTISKLSIDQMREIDIILSPVPNNT